MPIDTMLTKAMITNAEWKDGGLVCVMVRALCVMVRAVVGNVLTKLCLVKNTLRKTHREKQT